MVITNRGTDNGENIKIINDAQNVKTFFKRKRIENCIYVSRDTARDKKKYALYVLA